jgi:hypothetical protein
MPRGSSAARRCLRSKVLDFLHRSGEPWDFFGFSARLCPLGEGRIGKPYCAGMVISGIASVPPVWDIVKKNMTAVSARLVRKSPSSIQYQ